MSVPDFDFVIVGAGTAGCLLANRLSADGRHSVLLLEAGGRDNYPWIRIPVGYLYCIGNPRTDWMFQTEPEAGLNGRRLRYPRGRVLGGCSSINGMIYMRGQARDYDQWAALTGEPAWAWSACLPDFKVHEDHYRLDSAPRPPDPRNQPKTSQDLSAWHGHGGGWRVERQRLRWDILDAVMQAAEQAGIARTDDFNQGDNAGVGYFEVNQRGGWRWNTAQAFLGPDVRRRPNLTVWTNSTVQHLNWLQTDGALRCDGARVLRNDQTVSVRARREVILCAGAIGSPHLLQRSGVGPADWLRAAGVPVVRDLPGVGRNLQDHLQIRAVYRVQGATTLNTLSHSWWGKLGMALQYALTRSGPMSMAPSQLGAFVRSDPAQPWPNLEFHVQPLSLDAFGQPLHPYPAFTASVCNLNPESRGTVRLRNPDANQAPAIAPNYLSTETDRLIAAQSLRVVRHLVGQPALARYAPQEVKPGVQFQTDDELARLAGDIATTIFHPVGTTRMGRADDPDAVVDPHLRVRGVAGLRVVDAGAMPTITSGNTNSPTLMMAEKASRWILAGT